VYEANQQSKRRKQLQFAILITAVISIFAVILYMTLQPKENITIVGVGDSMPQIELLSLESEIVKLQASQTGPMLINLWASWCKPCINELPLLNEAQAFAPDVAFVAINMKEGLEQIIPMVERYDLTMLVLRDEQLAWKQALGVQGYPVSVLVDADGTIQRIHHGAYTEIEEILEQVAAIDQTGRE